MTSKVKDFSKGKAVTVETGGKPQATERSLEKTSETTKSTTEEIKKLRENQHE